MARQQQGEAIKAEGDGDGSDSDESRESMGLLPV